ncbi:MAG: 6-phosphofructokinase [Ruminococcaceae bacterium]|nr:6-phosphofructokinase [Oscillospiraceae bacterium]
MLKGNAIVGQSGGPTTAINATLAGVIKGAFESEAIDIIYGAHNGVEGMLDGRITNLNEVIKSEMDFKLLASTPAAALGSCRRKLPKMGEDDAVYEKLFDFFKANNIHYFFYIGGNDSMDTVAKVSAYAEAHNYEIKVMGVPKTIDNDVVGTDHTPGYGSASKYIATSMQEILRDCAVYTVKAVTIVEIMGRDAGWLTVAAGLPRIINGIGPDYIYLPERAFDIDKFIEDVKTALEKHPNVVIAVSEGLRDADGKYVGESAQSGATDVFGHKYLSGTGKSLELIVKEKIGCKVRSIELNLLQRCAAHCASKTDIEESLMVGAAAVKNATEGISGKMMCFTRTSSNPYTVEATYADIEKIANQVREVPAEFINEAGNNVTDECLEYIKPLISGESEVFWKDGLPSHFAINYLG